MTYTAQSRVPLEFVGETFPGTNDVFTGYIREQAVRQKREAVGDAFKARQSDREPVATLGRWVVSAATQHNPVIQATIHSREFDLVISRIAQLLQEEDDLKPSKYALRTALALVYEAYETLEHVFARAAVAVDEDGAISMYWRKPGKSLHLAIPTQEQGLLYLYHQENNDYGIERNISAATLAHWLKWFMHV